MEKEIEEFGNPQNIFILRGVTPDEINEMKSYMRHYNKIDENNNRINLDYHFFKRNCAQTTHKILKRCKTYRRLGLFKINYSVPSFFRYKLYKSGKFYLMNNYKPDVDELKVATKIGFGHIFGKILWNYGYKIKWIPYVWLAITVLPPIINKIMEATGKK